MPPLVLSSFELTDGVVKRGEAWLAYRQARQALELDLEGATRLLEGVLATTASYEQVYGALGVAYMRAKRYPECVDVSRRCVERVFDEEFLGACYYNLGKCLEHLGNDGAAYEAYRWSLEARASDVVERTIWGVARRLGQRGKVEIVRGARQELVEAASVAFLTTECPRGAVVKVDSPGRLSCGPLTVWGTSGRFTRVEAEEVLLAVADQRLEPTKGGGYGVLLASEGARWKRVATLESLAPGEGGVDFLGTLARGTTGTSEPVVQTFDCWQGCCEGVLEVLDIGRVGDAVVVRPQGLLTVGTSRGERGEPARRALITGVRRIDERGTGSEELLLRYETRLGKANPAISYLRLGLIDGTPTVRGAMPAEGVLPHCLKRR